MNKTMKTVQDYLTVVSDFYTRNADVFHLPSEQECKYYAISEAGEAADAYMRSIKPEHLRNFSKQTDFHMEVGDYKFMLLASMVADIADGEKINLIEETEAENANDIKAIQRSLGQLCDGNTLYAISQLHWNKDYSKDEISLTIAKLNARCRLKRLHTQGQAKRDAD